MVAAQIGEGADPDRQTFRAILRQSVARGFENGMADAFPRQPGHVRQECDNVRGGQAGFDLIVSRGDAKRPDRRTVVAVHPPQLAGKLGSRGLAVGPGHGSDMDRCRRKIAGRHPGEQPSWLPVRDMDHAFNLRIGKRHHRNCAGGNRCFDIIFAIELRTPERTENIAGCDLAVIDGKAGDRLFAGISIQSGYEITQLHHSALWLRLSASITAASIRIHRHRDAHRGSRPASDRPAE